MDKKYLWKFDADCGRQGNLEGLFVATRQEVKDTIGKYAYFGEVLGKHSEVCGNIEKDEISKVDLDSETVEKVSKILGDTWSGFNPLHYIHYKCTECGCSYHEDEFNKEKNLCEYCAKESD